MNYCAIKKCDIANGPGCRVSVFISGCTHHCPGCFQPETWDFKYGQRFGAETIATLCNLLTPDYISGLTILGGEPFEPQTIPDLDFALKCMSSYLIGKTIWAYSGYTYEELISRRGQSCKQTKQFLEKLDILVDGPFIESQRNVSLQFRGSENQRIIDLRKTREIGKLTLWDGKGV